MTDVGLPEDSRKQRARTAALGLSMLMASLGMSITSIALPDLSLAFAVSLQEVQAVVVSYLAAMTASVLLAGRLGDRFGMRRMLLSGIGLFALAALLCASAPGLWWLVAARMLHGIGAAFLMTLSMALMRQTAEPARLGRAMGVLGTISALGTALGPSLGGLLLPVAGWRGIFWIQVPIALFALLLASATLPRAARAGEGNSPGFLVVFDRRLLPNLSINLLVAAVMMATLVVGPFYLSLRLGLTATGVGLVMAFGPAISILSGVPAGRLVDRAGSRAMLTAGLVLMITGALLLAVLPNSIGIPGYVLAIGVLTPGYQLFQSANNTITLADVGADRRGTVSGLLTLSRNLGLIAGASVMGAVFSLGAGTGDLAHAGFAAMGAGMQATFLLAAVLLLAAIGLHLREGHRVDNLGDA